MGLPIDCDFDGGNIRCLSAAAPDDIRLEIRPDGRAAFFQWFFFRLRGAGGRDCMLKIENAGAAVGFGQQRGSPAGRIMPPGAVRPFPFAAPIGPHADGGRDRSSRCRIAMGG